MSEHKSGIYKITNWINGKFYIGSAVHFKKRWSIHKSQLNNKKHDNRHLQAAWNKYGTNQFIFHIIEFVDNLELLLEREQYWITLTNCCDRMVGYNLSPTAGSQLGIKRSAETLIRMKLSKIGIPLGPFSDNHRKNLSKASKDKAKSKDHADKNRANIMERCRDFDKWPHDLGSKCCCLECTEKKRLKLRAWRDLQRALGKPVK